MPLSPELADELRGRVGRLVPYATGIEDFHVHRMRHSFTCSWLERGGSLAALQQALGHESITTTQRYAKLSDEALMREAARLEGRCR